MDGMSPDDLRETLNEVKVLQSLHHPFVIEMQSCFLTSKHLNIVMPLADCGDLSSYIKSHKGSPLAEADVLMLFTQICCALKHVHDRKILHRDIKSANILLCTGVRGNLEAKLADFGIARVLQGTMELASTAVGTPYYMSPELCKNENYDAKSDVWALGCLLYEMCTQKNPFTGANFSGLALKILRGKYPPLPLSYSHHVSALVSMMLEVDAQKRPSVSQILKLPYIASLLPRVLDKETLRREFSHTVLHGFCADDLKSALQAAAAEPRYESQFQPLRVHSSQDAPSARPERDQDKPAPQRPAAKILADVQKQDGNQEQYRQPHAPCSKQPESGCNAAFKAQCPSFDGPSQDAKKMPCAQPSCGAHQSSRVSVPAASEVSAKPIGSAALSVLEEPSTAAQAMQQTPVALQQPNEPNPPAAAFVIVHVETPMHLSSKTAAKAEPAKILHQPESAHVKKPLLGSTVRTDFTLLGSTLKLEQKASQIEASASLRVEMLRAYLEKNLGVDVFCKCVQVY
jgi:NIMA (never in mitosis gene a)-related kinase